MAGFTVVAGGPKPPNYMADPNPAGLKTPGNIDLNTRPEVKTSWNPTNTDVATVRSASFSTDQGEVLLPTVSDDGRLLSDQDAIDQYKKTGKHLGIFDTPDNADAYAEKLHEQQAHQFGLDKPAPPAQSYALNDATIWGMKAGLNLKLSPVQQMAVGARLKGYSWDDFNATLGKQISDWHAQHYDDAAIGATLGLTPDAISHFETTAKMAAAKAAEADPGPENNDFWTNLTYGVTNNSSLAPWLPQQKPVNPGFGGRLEQGLGQSIPSMAAYAVGSLLGGPWVGGTLGWFVDASMRAGIADIRANGPLSSKDAAARIIGIGVNAAKDTAPVAAMGPAGEAAAVGMKALGVASKVATGAARTGAEATAMVAAQSAIEGHIPSQEELYDLAIQLAVLHGARLTAKGLKIGVKALTAKGASAEAAGGVEGSRATSVPGQEAEQGPGPSPVPSHEEIAAGYHALNKNWADTGEPPRQAFGRVQADDPARIGHTDPAPVAGVFPTEETLAAAEKAPKLPSWHGDASGPPEASIAEVRTELADPKVQNALAQPKVIDRTTDVPYAAGYTKDGGTILIDRHMPTSLSVDGKPFPTDHFLAIHEAVEKVLIDKYAKGWTGTQQQLYLKGHAVATAIEHAQERAAGFDPKKVEDALAPYIKAEGSEKVTNVHPNLDMTPYSPTHQLELGKRIVAGTGASTSHMSDYEKAQAGEGGGGRPVYDGNDLTAPPTAPVLPEEKGPAVAPKPLKEMSTKAADGLYALGGRVKVRKAQFMKYVRQLSPEFGKPPAEGGWPTLDEKMYDHMDNPSGVPLDEHEQALWDKFIQPLKDREATARPEAAKYQSRPPTEEELLSDPESYVHHILQGETEKSDTLQSGAPDVPQGEAKGANKAGPLARLVGKFRRIPPTTASSQRASTFYTITDGDNRHVVSEYPGGNGVHFWKNGAKQKAYGGFIKAVPERVIPAHEVQGKTVTERPVVAKVAEKDILDAAGRVVTHKGDLTEPYVKEGGRFVPDSESKDRTIPEHYTRGTLSPGNMFVDMNGKAWNIERARTGEKEMHTGLQYQKSAIANTIANIVELEGAADTGKVLDNLKNELTSNGYMAESRDAPKEWSTVDDWRFDGLKVHPEVAYAFNDYIRGSTSAAKTNIFNRLGVAAMFALPSGLLGHAKNIFGQGWAAAGWNNLSAKRSIGLTAKAMREVNTLGPDYMRLVGKGAGLLSSDMPGWHPSDANDLNSVILKAVGKAIDASPEMSGLIQKVVGTGHTAGQSYMNGMSHELYRYNDIRYMKRYYQVKAAHPDASDEAIIKQVERSFPNYRLPSTIGGSRWLAQVMGNRNIIQFGRYAISKYSTIFNNIHDAISPDMEADSRGEAIGRLVFQVIGMTAGQYALDQVAKFATQNQDARFLEGGIFGVAEDAFDFGGHLLDTALHPDKAHQMGLADDFYKNVGKLVSPATASWEGLQQIVGMDFFTGKPLAEGGIAQNIAERGWHFAQNVIGTEVEAMDNWPKYIQQSLGVSVPSPAAKKYDANQAKTDAANAKAKAKKDPALLRGLYQHLGG